MNYLIQQIVMILVQRRLRRKNMHQLQMQGQADAKALRIATVEVQHVLKETIMIVIGVASAGFGLGGFLLPNQFIDGGVVGISLLTEVVTGIDVSILLVLINLPFLLLGGRVVSWSFAIKSIVAIVLLALVVHEVPYPTVTEDKLLVAVFGGFFLGAGIGMTIRGGAVIDGTEVAAVFISRKSSLTIGDVILIMNLIIFGFGAYILTVETALYAILTYLAASKTVDFVIDGIEEYIGVTIVSPFSEEIREVIVNKLGRGCTIYMGRGGLGRKAEQTGYQEILYTVITRLELSKLRSEVEKIDEGAFMIMSSIKDTKGGMVKKRPLKK